MALGRIQVDVVHADAEPGQNLQLGSEGKQLLVPLIHADNRAVDFGRPYRQLVE